MDLTEQEDGDYLGEKEGIIQKSQFMSRFTFVMIHTDTLSTRICSFVKDLRLVCPLETDRVTSDPTKTNV